jgi:hypothetical protein
MKKRRKTKSKKSLIDAELKNIDLMELKVKPKEKTSIEPELEGDLPEAEDADVEMEDPFLISEASKKTAFGITGAYCRYNMIMPRQEKLSSYGGMDNIAWISEKRQLLMDLVNELMVELDTLDAAIEYCGVLLRICQPPIPGKFDIRWWKVRPGFGREPVLVKWVLMKGSGRWTTIEVKRIRRSVKDIPIPLMEERDQVVERARVLIEKRDSLVTHLGMTQKNHKMNLKQNTCLDHLYLNQLNETIVKKLMANGYPVDNRYFPNAIWGGAAEKLMSDVLKVK